MSKLTYKNGRPNGIFTEWHENGQKFQETTFKNNKQNGLLTEWSETGKVLSANIYKNGKKVSTQIQQAA